MGEYFFQYDEKYIYSIQKKAAIIPIFKSKHRQTFPFFEGLIPKDGYWISPLKLENKPKRPHGVTLRHCCQELSDV
jgi:hypothetical protein